MERSPIGHLSPDSWQADLAHRFAAHLSQRSEVAGVVVVGSCAATDPQLDQWSDLDLVVIVDYNPTGHAPPDWLGIGGEIYLTESQEHKHGVVHRTWYRDLRRVDVIETERSDLGELIKTSGLFGAGAIVMSSRDQSIREAIARRTADPPRPHPLERDEFSAKAKAFRVKVLLALNKLGRADLLIASDLALDLVKACLLMSMLQRDRAAGTSHHRFGSGVAEIPEELRAELALSSQGVLALIERAVTVHQQLAPAWSGEGADDWAPVAEAIRRVRHKLAPT